MQEIGKLLQEERIKQKLTLEEVSSKTKITLSQLKAIEEGDIEFFKNDISYIKFYIKSYASVLGIPYDELKGQVDQTIIDYTQSLSLKSIQEQEAMEQNIRRKAKSVDSKIPIRVEKKKKDYSLLLLLLAVVLLIGGLGFVFVNSILPSFSKKPSIEDGAVVVTGNDENGNTQLQEPPVIQQEDKAIVVQELNPKTYELVYYQENEQIAIQIDFGADTWIQVYYDDIESSNPQSRVYLQGEVVEILSEAKADLKISIHFGYLKSNTIQVNKQTIVLNDSIKDSTSGIKLNFILVKGEQ